MPWDVTSTHKLAACLTYSIEPIFDNHEGAGNQCICVPVYYYDCLSHPRYEWWVVVISDKTSLWHATNLK